MDLIDLHALARLVPAVAALLLPLSASADSAEQVGDTLYRDGHYESALERWERAAEGGDAGSAYRLGASLIDGVVTRRDLPRGAHWLQRAAEAGDRRAQVDLGTLYDNGWGVTRSHVRAARWYRAAAQDGDATGQFNLASMYEQGQGVERDPVAAYMWFTLALQGGMGRLARDGLERLETQLGPEQIEAARAEAARFEPRPGSRVPAEPEA